MPKSRSIYRQIRSGHKKVWSGDGALEKYLPILAHRVRPGFWFRPVYGIGEPRWQAANLVFVDGESSLHTAQTGLGLHPQYSHLSGRGNNCPCSNRRTKCNHTCVQ